MNMKMRKKMSENQREMRMICSTLKLHSKRRFSSAKRKKCRNSEKWKLKNCTHTQNGQQYIWKTKEKLITNTSTRCPICCIEKNNGISSAIRQQQKNRPLHTATNLNCVCVRVRRTQNVNNYWEAKKRKNKRKEFVQKLKSSAQRN